MSRPKPTIPDVPPGEQSLVSILSAIKENIELQTGVRQGAVTKLPPGAPLADVITKLNELIDRVNR